MTDIKRGSAARFECEARDFGGDHFDPDTHSAKVYDEAGALQKEETNPSKDTSNPQHPFFYFYWTVPGDATPGTWKIVWACVKATYTSIEDKTFKVVA